MSAHIAHSISSFVDIPVQFYSPQNSGLQNNVSQVVSSESVVGDLTKPTLRTTSSNQSSQSKPPPTFINRIFGSKNGVIREEERRKHCKHWVVHPCSRIRIYWDLLMLCILLINVIFLPVEIVFFHDFHNIGWIVFNVLSDLVFLIDIILNFWTGIIINEACVILDLKKIRKIYAKRWLVLDILSIFPFDYICDSIFNTNNTANSALRLLKLIKLVSLLRLCRVVRFLYYFAKWEELFNATKSIAPVIKFVFAVFILAHWNACVQFLIPYLQGFPNDSWVSINNLQNASVGTQYSWGLFKAFSHMLCIGFGRWPPQNDTEVWMTMISMLIGASLYAMFIGHISTLIHSVTTASRSYNEKLKQVEEYMRYRKLPHEIKLKVHEYYYQRYRGQLFNEEAILSELSQTLKEDVINFNCRKLIQVVPIFSNANEAFITSVLTRLKFEVFLPDEHIIRCGAIGTKMYFIQHGTVDVICSDGSLIAQLSEGSYFGEICLLMKCRRVAGVRSISVCDLYSLSKEDFELVLDEFSEMRTLMESVARERLQTIQTDSTQPDDTDLQAALVSSSPRQGQRVNDSSYTGTDPGDMV